MLSITRFLWNATRGHRLTPWRSPYLLWRIETYCGVKMQQIGFLEFWEFLWRERGDLWRFLKWAAELERYMRPSTKQSCTTNRFLQRPRSPGQYLLLFLCQPPATEQQRR